MVKTSMATTSKSTNKENLETILRHGLEKEGLLILAAFVLDAGHGIHAQRSS